MVAHPLSNRPGKPNSCRIFTYSFLEAGTTTISTPPRNFDYYAIHYRLPHWSSGQRDGRWFDSRNFHDLKCELGLERGPPSLVRTIR